VSGEFFGLVIIPAVLFAGGWLLFYTSETTYQVVLAKIFGFLLIAPFLFIASMSANMPHVHDDPAIAPTYGMFILAGIIFKFNRKVGIYSTGIPYAVMLYFYLSR
jgi:hypothetical protein